MDRLVLSEQSMKKLPSAIVFVQLYNHTVAQKKT